MREFAADDFEALREIEADPEVLRYRSRKIITERMTREFLEHAQTSSRSHPRHQYAFALILRSSQRLIGQCGLTLTPPDYRQAYLWFALQRRAWGQGYISEAVTATVQFGLQRLQLSCVHAACHPDNRASQRVLEKAGLRLQAQPPAEVRDGHLYYRLCVETNGLA